MTYLNRKVVIWGKGSIGVRHYNNLLKLGYDIYFLRRKCKKKKEINKKNLISLNPLFCIICTPTIYHVQYSNFCLKHKIPVYIEKPLGYNEDKLEIKKLIIYSKKITVHGGFNLNYCKELNRYIDRVKKIKYLKFAEFIWKTNSRNWHPGENYKKSYAFKKSLGGGVIHTCSHEINILNNFFNNLKLIKVNKIFTEGICSAYNAKFKDGRINIDVNIDFMSDKNQRIINFFDGKKKYTFDFFNYDYKKINDISYMQSMKDFIKCIHKNKQPKSSFLDALKTYKILEKLNNE